MPGATVEATIRASKRSATTEHNLLWGDFNDAKPIHSRKRAAVRFAVIECYPPGWIVILHTISRRSLIRTVIPFRRPVIWFSSLARNPARGLSLIFQ